LHTYYPDLTFLLPRLTKHMTATTMTAIRSRPRVSPTASPMVKADVEDPGAFDNDGVVFSDVSFVSQSCPVYSLVQL